MARTLSIYATFAQRTTSITIEYFGRGVRGHVALVPCPFMADKGDMQSVALSMQAIVNFALPPRCPACGLITAEADQFCLTCWQQLRFLSQPACATCDLPLPYTQDEQAQCAECLAKPPGHSGIKAAVAYGDISREIALKLKHGGKIGLAKLVANLLRRYLQAMPGDAILVPVPLHWTRLWRRRYNQSALIARHLSRISGLEHRPDALLRTRRTTALGGLSARERARMVKGAFAINKRQLPRIAGKRVILVDDVYTSGATTDACVATLLKAGAASVTIFCWARVLPEALEAGLHG